MAVESQNVLLCLSLEIEVMNIDYVNKDSLYDFMWNIE